MTFRTPNHRTLEDWGMFSTHSSVTQLRPETVVECVQEAEEAEWSKGDLNDFFPQEESGIPCLGTILLSQSGSMEKIHNYFSQLESRKCCLHLTCRRMTINSMRVVVSSNRIDDGSGKKRHQAFEVRHLENEDLRAFKHAYLCAVYPVLAAPKPPSPASPSPGLNDSATASMTNSFHAHHHSAMFSSNPDKSTLEGRRPTTPNSLHDSGMEESDEAGLIPMESICEQLQRAFKLNRTVFRQYENMIIKSYTKKTSQKLLAEELCGQLAVLENNNHPFYSSTNFITQNGYDLWQKQERAHISCLLNKFWHNSLPFPADSQDLIAELHTVHEDYLILLKKLLSYEGQFRQESGERNSMSFSSLSSASCRLLIEFGLRYGIGELFQKIQYLECLSNEFNLSLGYLTFIQHLVNGIHQSLPANKSSVIMVKRELHVLQTTLRTLKVQTCKALSQMKSHFYGNKPVEGIDLLLTLLRSVLSLMRYLAPSGTDIPDFQSCIKSTIQSSFQPTYEKFKMVARNDLRETRETQVTPRLLNWIIQDTREDVFDYKNNFEATFQKYFSISKLAAISYYRYLIEDIKNLCEGAVKHEPELEIDLRMLALVYRLDKLERDWTPYIHELKLTWRNLFLPSVSQWTTAMKVHVQNLVLEAVSCDTFNSRNIELSFANLRAYQVSSSCSNPSQSVSLTHSENSAFSSIINNSSLRSSSPYQGGNNHIQNESAHLMHKSIEETGQEEATQNRDEQCPQPMRRMSSFVCETRSLDFPEETPLQKSVFSPANRQQSLPAKLDLAAVESEEDIFPFGNPDESSVTESNTTLDQKDSNISSRTSRNEIITTCDKTTDKIPQSSVFVVVSPPDDIVHGDSDNEGEEHQEEARDDEDSSSSDEEVNRFKFPELKLHTPIADLLLPDRDFPDCQSPLGSQSANSQQTSMPNFILNNVAPPSMSSKASSLAEYPEVQRFREENNFSESMDSIVSFPSPTISEAMLPVSGSAVDLLIMLQRICNFGRNVVTIMLPDDNTSRPSSRENRMPPMRFSGFTNWRHTDPSSSREGFVSENYLDEPRKPVFTTQAANTGDSSSDSHRQQPSNDGGHSIPERENTTSAENSSSSHTSTSAPEEASQKMKDDFYSLKFRLSLHLRLVKLLEMVQTQQADGLIWGCRHQRETNYDCLHYPNHRSRFLNGRYEAVTRNMATRINNVFGCLKFMEDFRHKLSKALYVDEETKDCTTPLSFEDKNWEDFDVLWQDFSPESYDSENNLADNSIRSSVFDSKKILALKERWTKLVQEAFSSTKFHVMAILTAMCRLLAQKLNLFTRDGLPLLLHLKTENISMPTLLERITTFLQKHLDALSNWMYKECFRRTLDSLWVFMVQNFEVEAEILKSNEANPSNDAHKWLLAISHLIKFMNNNGKGIKKELMLSQADNVLFRFQLYTLPTIHLIALFFNLREYYFEGDQLTLEEAQLRKPPSILHRIHNDLQSLSKCFSGARLVKWLIDHRDNLPADLPGPFGPNPTQSAVTLCQLFLDQQFIQEIDMEYLEKSQSPVSISYPDGISPFPALSILSHSYSTPMLCKDFDGLYTYVPQATRTASMTKCLSSDDDEMTAEDTETEHEKTRSVLSFRVSTPVQAQTVRADVHAPYEKDENSTGVKQPPCDNNGSKRAFDIVGQSVQQKDAESVSSSLKEELGRECSPLSCTPVQDQLSNQHVRIGHKDSITSDESCYVDMCPVTPFGGHYSSIGSHGFQDSSHKFYFINQNALHMGLISHHQSSSTASRNDSELSDVDRTLLQIRFSNESHKLVEQCVLHKVSSMSLLCIVASRKKTDKTAKEFLNKLPFTLRNKVNKQLSSPVVDCRSS